MTIIAPTQNRPPPLSLPTIHAYWTAALSLPPTAQLSNLRRLVRAVTKDHHPALRPLSLAALSPLYIDLALAYAFLGEYYLASTVFKAAVENDAASAVGWFGLGLAQAELAEWRNARRSWKECLRCFESAGGRRDSIRYLLFQSQDEPVQDEPARMLKVGLHAEEWMLERTKVEFNWRVALHEKGSKKLGVAPRAAGEKRLGLNGIPAGLRFGPGWDANLQSLDSPLLVQYSGSRTAELVNVTAFTSTHQPAPPQTPSSSAATSRTRASLPPRISSRKPLPALPRSPPTSTPSLADVGHFNDRRPSLDQDPFTNAPEHETHDPFDDNSSQTLTLRPLPALPLSPQIPTPSLTDTGGYFNKSTPSSLHQDPFTTSSPENGILIDDDPFDTSCSSSSSSSQTLTLRPYGIYHKRLSRQSTLFTPVDASFFEGIEDENGDDGSYNNDNDNTSAAAMIDDTISSWSGGGQTDRDGTLVTQIQEEDEAEHKNLTPKPPKVETVQTHHPPFNNTGEILLPRVFEGFRSRTAEPKGEVK